MQWRRDVQYILVTMVPGDKLQEGLLQAAREAGVQAAEISGLGGVTNIELGLVKADMSGYTPTRFTGLWELVSLTGNLSQLEGQPFLHLHAALGGQGGEMRGGHLLEAEISVTAEIFMRPLQEPLQRGTSPYFAGIKVWNFGT